MDSLRRKLHEIENSSIIEEPKEQRLYIDNDKELLLHERAKIIMESHVKDLEDFKNNIDGSTCPKLSEAEEAIVDQSRRLLLLRFLLLFQDFSKCFITLGDPSAEHIFWLRFIWLLDETQKYAVQSLAEANIFEAPGFFSLCAGEQDRRLKPVYDKWDRTLFSEKSYRDYVNKVFSEDVKLPEPSKEQLEQWEKEEQADIEFDNKVFAEKCPTCPTPCEWYKDEKEKRLDRKV